jgi:magnesium transporter
MAEDDAAREVLEDARRLAEAGEWAKLVALVAGLHPADLAELVLDLNEEQRKTLLDHLPTDIVGQLFEFAEDDELRDLIRGVGIEDLPAVLGEVEDDVAADVIQQLEPEEQAETLAALDRGEEVAELMAYGDESAGGIMTRGFVALNEGITVQQAIDYLRVLRPPADRAYYLYVIDPEKRLQGTVSIRDLIVSAPRTTLAELTQHDIHAVNTGTDQEEAARLLQRYNLLAVPVVDEDGRLEGVLTADDLIDVLQEEATEDMYRMAGVGVKETPFSPVLESARRRVPWLGFNMVWAFLGAGIISLFQDTLDKAAFIAIFMPMIAGQAGNAGIQTATIVVRSMALGEVEASDTLRILRKEWALGFLKGTIFGGILAVVAWVWQGNVTLGFVAGGALFLNMIIASTAGVVIPITLNRFGIDPATIAGVFDTMLTDLMGFLIYLGLATIFISQLT